MHTVLEVDGVASKSLISESKKYLISGKKKKQPE